MPHARVETTRKPNFVSSQVAEARRYYLNLAPAATDGITVVCGGCERMQRDYVVQRADFPFLCVEFVAEGEGELELGGERCRLQPGIAFAYLPGVAHTIRNDPSSPMLKYYVDFAGREGERLLARTPLAGGKAVQISAPDEVIELFETLQRNGSGEGALVHEICAAFIPVLLLKITERAVAGGKLEPRALASYRHARQIIEKQYRTLHNVEAAARACHFDAAYLCRLFQRFGHVSPYQFLTRLKMSRAAELLLDGNLMVKEAAAELGFADAFHFSRTFKRIYGLPPERFVRQARARQGGSEEKRRA